jgi:hypothetical protein
VRRHRALIAAIVLALVVGLVPMRATVADAQEPPATAMTTQDIVPKPNSGHAPTEAGDRGGALQLLILALLAGAVGGGVLHLTRESRRARSEVGSGG